MNKESHRRYLKASARRETQKALTRHPDTAREKLLRLKVQTVEPWKRVLAGVISAGTSVVGLVLMRSEDGSAGPWLLLAGILGLLFALFGWRRTLDGLSNVIDVTDLLDGLFD